MSLLDSAEFNARLFFPRAAHSAPPPGASDFFAEDWHVRRHVLLPGAPSLLLFQKRLVLIDGGGHDDMSLAPQYWEALAQHCRG